MLSKRKWGYMLAALIIFLVFKGMAAQFESWCDFYGGLAYGLPSVIVVYCLLNVEES